MSPIRRRWQPTPAIQIFFLLLIICSGITLWQPTLWPWTLGIVLAYRFFLVIIALIPRSTLLGPNLIKLPQAAIQRKEVAITIDDGPNPKITPQVLDILDQYQAKATFFCIGQKAEQHPELCQEIVRRGHEIGNHTYTHHWFFSLFGPKRMQQEIQCAQHTIAQASGQTPVFFRPTAGLRNPELEWVLSRCGMHLSNWSVRGFDTRISDPKQILQRLTQKLQAGDIFLLHDNNVAYTTQGEAVICAVLPLLLDHIKAQQLHSVTLSQAHIV